MKSNNHKKITIKDPERWGLKYGAKRQWYYKMRLDFLSDPLIQGVNNTTKAVFLAIISESLRENSAQLSMCLEFIKHQLRVDLDTIKLSLRELKDNDIIKLHTNVRTQLIEENKREEKRIEQNSKINCVDDPPPHVEEVQVKVPKKSKDQDKLMEEILEMYNRNAPEHSMPQVHKLSVSRKKKFKIALKDYPSLDDWKKIFSVASTKGFTGKDGREFVPNFDYVFRNENYHKFFDEYDLIFKQKKQSQDQLVKEVESHLYRQLGL